MARPLCSRALAVVLVAMSMWFAPMCLAQTAATDFSRLFAEQVSVKDPLSKNQVARYRSAMLEVLAPLHVAPRQEFVVVVDRSPGAQHLLLFLGSGPDTLFIGASPVSTGATGHLDHYITPTGVFENSRREDFRAQGIENEIGVRGYGRHGMRVWDFGWQAALKGWTPEGREESGQIRLQMHATDPSLLESHLGYRHSKGCIRIAASLNEFLDRYGVLDASYDAAAAKRGHPPWVWGPNHIQTPYSGRYVIVLDTPSTKAATP
jgi:hypothetical protein